MDFKKYIHQEYEWPDISNEEVERLSNVLAIHLRQMGLKKTKEERKIFVKKLLIEQKGTCAFADGIVVFVGTNQKIEILFFLNYNGGINYQEVMAKKHMN